MHAWRPLAVTVWSFLVAGALSFGDAAEIRVGDSADTVREELGEPAGLIRIDGFEVYYYSRGNVHVQDGIVQRVNLISEEALADKQRRDEEQRRRQQEEAEAHRHELLLEGLAIRERMLQDGESGARSPRDQVQAWKDFRTRYPDVPLGGEYEQALHRLETELERERADAEARARETEMRVKVLELEQRIADAEARARDAEARAREAEQDARYSRSYVAYPVVYTPAHTVVTHPTRRVHTVTVPQTCTSTSTTITHGNVVRQIDRTTCHPTATRSLQTHVRRHSIPYARRNPIPYGSSIHAVHRGGSTHASVHLTF